MNILIVVDMQKDFIDGALGTPEAVRIVPYVKEVIERFDGKVFFTSEKPLKIGDYVKIKITDTLDYDLIGEVIE